MNTETAICLTRAIREHSGLELNQLREAGKYGADAGWPGFTYYNDTSEFTATHRELIWTLLSDTADEFGVEPLEMVSQFSRAAMANDPDGFDCLLAWFALEECGRFWNDRREER